MNTKQIDIDIKFYNNGTLKETSLKGFAFVESGFLSGQMNTTDKLSNSEQVLVTAFSFTGCPIAARVEDSSLNPWLLTNGSYKSARMLHSPFLKVHSQLTSIGHHDKIKMELILKCEGNTDGLQSIKDPFQESIYQVSPGILEGKFNLIFLNEKEEEIPASATSKYELNVYDNVRPVWRNIVILNALNKDKFVQTEQIDLFGDKQIADQDLMEKTMVF
jgi:hypothetical protein